MVDFHISLAQFAIFKKQLKLKSGNDCSLLHKDNAGTEGTQTETSEQKRVRKSHMARIQT